MKNKLKTVLVVVLVFCLFQTNFFHTNAKDIEGTQVSETTDTTNEQELAANESHQIYVTLPSHCSTELYVNDVRKTTFPTTADSGNTVDFYLYFSSSYMLNSLKVVKHGTTDEVTVKDMGDYYSFTMPDYDVDIVVEEVYAEPHSVSVTTVNGGSVTVTPDKGTVSSVLPNVRVIVDPSTWEGYETDFDNLSIVDADGNTISYTVVEGTSGNYFQFYMPASNVTITPVFNKISGYKYKIKDSSTSEGFTIKWYENNGTSASPSWSEITDGKVAADKQVKYSITLSKGYGLRKMYVEYTDPATLVPKVLVNGRKAEGTFTMPSASIKFTVTTSTAVPHCQEYNEEDEKICDVCETGYTRSDDGKTCSQTSPISFATDDWKLVNDCALNISTCPYEVGDTRILKIDGNEYTVRIANMSTPAACSSSSFSQSACGFVIEFYTCITTMDMNVNESATKSSTNGGWTGSSVNSYLTTFLTSLKQNVVTGGTTPLGDIMITTKVVTGSNYGEKQSGTDTLTTSRANLYLLSLHEVYDGSKNSTYTDVDYDIASMDNGYSYTRQLDIYSGLKTTSSSESKSTLVFKNTSTQSSARDWWLRTPSNQKENNNTHYYAASTFGGAGYKRVISNIHGYAKAVLKIEYVEKGVAPAFRIGKSSNSAE